MLSLVCLIVSSVFGFGGGRTYIAMVRSWLISLTYVWSAFCVCQVRCLLTSHEQEILFAMDTVLCLLTRARRPLLCFVSVWSLSMYISSGVSGGRWDAGKVAVGV